MSIRVGRSVACGHVALVATLCVYPFVELLSLRFNQRNFKLHQVFMMVVYVTLLSMLLLVPRVLVLVFILE